MLGGFKPNPTEQLNKHIVHCFLCLENTHQEVVRQLTQEESRVLQREQSQLLAKVNEKKKAQEFGSDILKTPFVW